MTGNPALLKKVQNDFDSVDVSHTRPTMPVLAAPGIATVAAFSSGFGQGVLVTAAAWGAAAAGAQAAG